MNNPVHTSSKPPRECTHMHVHTQANTHKRLCKSMGIRVIGGIARVGGGEKHMNAGKGFQAKVKED